jgi:hypothetical protein
VEGETTVFKKRRQSECSSEPKIAAPAEAEGSAGVTVDHLEAQIVQFNPDHDFEAMEARLLAAIRNRRTVLAKRVGSNDERSIEAWAQNAGLGAAVAEIHWNAWATILEQHRFLQFVGRTSVIFVREES